MRKDDGGCFNGAITADLHTVRNRSEDCDGVSRGSYRSKFSLTTTDLRTIEGASLTERGHLFEARNLTGSSDRNRDSLSNFVALTQKPIQSEHLLLAIRKRFPHSKTSNPGKTTAA